MTSSMQQDSGSAGVDGGPRQGQQLQDAASGLLDQAARTADAQASTTMTRAGDALQGIARAIEDAAGQLRETQPEVANFVQTAVGRVDSAATYLRDHNASDALQNVQELARRQPAVVVGGGLAIGLLIGRFLRSGASGGQEMGGGSYRGYRGGSYGRDAYGGGAYGAGGYGGGTGYAGSAYGAEAEYGAGSTRVGGTYGAGGMTGVGGGTTMDVGSGMGGDLDAPGSTGALDQVDTVVTGIDDDIADIGDADQDEAPTTRGRR